MFHHLPDLLVGDSAGANLALLAAAAAVNNYLLDRLVHSTGINLHSWAFPKINRVVSIYGMLDQDAWHAGSGCYQRTLACLYRASLPLEVLCPTIGTTPFHVSFAWLLREEPKQMLSLPPILLCCGDKDFLLSSSKGVASRRNAMGYSATLRIYPGHHAFLGLPPGWTFHRCFENSIPCANDVLMQILQS